jgi:hypothetical protein
MIMYPGLIASRILLKGFISPLAVMTGRFEYGM